MARARWGITHDESEGRRVPGCGSAFGRCHRQAHGHDSAALRVVPGFDDAMMFINDTPNDGQPEPGASPPPGKKWIEQVGQILRLKSGA